MKTLTINKALIKEVFEILSNTNGLDYDSTESNESNYKRNSRNIGNYIYWDLETNLTIDCEVWELQEQVKNIIDSMFKTEKSLNVNKILELTNSIIRNQESEENQRYIKSVLEGTSDKERVKSLIIIDVKKSIESNQDKYELTNEELTEVQDAVVKHMRDMKLLRARKPRAKATTKRKSKSKSNARVITITL